MPNLSQGAYDMCAWTGRAIRVSKLDFDIDLMHDDQGLVIPAMPDDLFSEQAQLIQMMLPAGGEALECYNTSKVVTWEVFNVPPRPDPNKADLKYHIILKQRVDTVRMGSFIPTGILKDNINENEGLCRILRHHYENNNMHIRGALECAKYHHLNTDMAIFWRILKVVFFIPSSFSININAFGYFLAQSTCLSHTHSSCSTTAVAVDCT